MEMKPEKKRGCAVPKKMNPGSRLTPQERKTLLFIVGLLVLGAIVKWLHAPAAQ